MRPDDRFLGPSGPTCAADTLYKLIHQHQIPSFKIGSDYRFLKDAIEKLIADREEKGRPPKSAPS